MGLRKGGALPGKMALPALLRPFSKLLAPARLPSGSSARSKFYIREPPHDRPDWLKVGLTLGTSAFLWIYVRSFLHCLPPPILRSLILDFLIKMAVDGAPGWLSH
ncbi:NADH dehydrogenase [ubiquinone] 1 subunit C1, mitochondrial isoform X1 [Zalophus californianus]|uniref:NADH dehydrogenase [ubiquinone] 1 subunit C1, mitochondrial n=1 Tax=Zalophus californianus TaxID=9704 RepID=A0A6J2DHD1_ZALCA|nr:NADH dehydrogenase [ubiquinone] 1 subunit C1, mitochondrial isoform X1 [Zalophus californianus]